jgi:hypothetical protein
MKEITSMLVVGAVITACFGQTGVAVLMPIVAFWVET